MKGKTRIFMKMRKKKTYKRKKYGSGIKVRRPYINKRNRLMLGEGKKIKNKGVVFLHQFQQRQQDQQSK